MLVRIEILMNKFRKSRVQTSNRIKLKRSQKVYMFLGLIISLLASVTLFVNAENASQRQEVWMTTKAITAGQIINKQSVELIKVDLGVVANNYLDNESEVVGKSALQPLTIGTLLKSENIGIKSGLRNVALRISNGHLPPLLELNDWVDVWFSDPITLSSTLIIPKLAVVWIDEVDSNFGGVTTVVLAVPENNVLQLINSARVDGIDLVQREN